MTDIDPPFRKPVGAVIAAVRILRYLGGIGAPVGVNQIAREARLNPSTCFNILRTLLSEQLVTFDPVAKTYALGFGLAALAKPALEGNSYVKLIRPYLLRLAREHAVTMTLWYRVRADRVMLVDSVESGGAIRIRMTVGQRLPLTIGALGRCMAAQENMSRAKLGRLFEGLRWETPLDFETYVGQVEAARRNGYAVDQEHFAKGITTVSSTIPDGGMQPIMALSAVALSAQLQEPSLGLLCRKVRDAAREITVALTHMS